MTSQIYKKKFSTKVDETLHFRRLQDSYKRNNFGVNHYISGHVISQIMEFMPILVSQPFSKIETSCLDQKFSELMCRTFHLFGGHQLHF